MGVGDGVGVGLAMATGGAPGLSTSSRIRPMTTASITSTTIVAKAPRPPRRVSSGVISRIVGRQARKLRTDWPQRTAHDHGTAPPVSRGRGRDAGLPARSGARGDRSEETVLLVIGARREVE